MRDDQSPFTPEFVPTPSGSTAVRRSGTSGPPIVFCHGNSFSSRSFEKQLESTLRDRYRLIAIDLPGHGDSTRSATPDATYTLGGYADALVAVAGELDATGAVFVGWSLGGHVVLEASPRLASAAGLLVFGTPPVASLADFQRAVLAGSPLQAAFREESSDEEIHEFLAAVCGKGFSIPDVFVDDFRRTDRRARAALGASVARNELLDEIRIVAELKKPFAVIHGTDDAIVDRRYLTSLSMPSLWRAAIQELPGVGHAPQWEAPQPFNRLLDEFAADCNRRA